MWQIAALVSAVIVFVALTEKNTQETFADGPTSDYSQSMRNVRMKLNEIFGTVKQVGIDMSKLKDVGARTDVLEKRMDDSMITNDAKFNVIQKATMTKLDRLQFDEAGRVLVCDVDGSNCETLAPVVVPIPAQY